MCFVYNGQVRVKALRALCDYVPKSGQLQHAAVLALNAGKEGGADRMISSSDKCVRLKLTFCSR
ncbi:uncharacterized protein PHACADRAFT_161846 [Phanerochaete carnosa HHB-10118-sp]|uniref:Uncharacterized protein n=1 Tax=Phanerochaete carnosa (strain HHB-10118-sp) TaxID=650164 RepID=K5WZ91_PHACS|nr:uncharacterized protein PHACADRAFT_161846 [Phanerochaete carnosa HHB-10118-sp]EKM55797.1 hypothetical protein PHACADRAFT_161846 [Phanerochaete carnosa HHB-10118-sp]